jgi:hypothetical protein
MRKRVLNSGLPESLVYVARQIIYIWRVGLTGGQKEERGKMTESLNIHNQWTASS